MPKEMACARPVLLNSEGGVDQPAGRC